jgi:hypothetical protein
MATNRVATATGTADEHLTGAATEFVNRLTQGPP